MEILDLAKLIKNKALERKEILKGKSVYNYLCYNSTSERSALLIHHIVKILKPEFCIEIGTCLGFSALFILDALNKNKRGKLVTIEKDEASVKIAKELLSITDTSRVIFKIGKTQEILSDIVKELKRIDFCYIDGEHRKETVLFELCTVFQKLSEKGLIVMDDVIANNDEMREAWAIIKSKKGVFWRENEKFGFVTKIDWNKPISVNRYVR